jgi:hypothetical protein
MKVLPRREATTQEDQQLVDVGFQIGRAIEVQELGRVIHEEQAHPLHEVHRQVAAELSLGVEVCDEGADGAS